VVPADRVPDVLAAARNRAAKEAGYLDRLRAGETTMAVYGFSRPVPTR
jgi:4-hydroxy-4-methyl-2-oxoglutarate aldolase